MSNLPSPPPVPMCDLATQYKAIQSDVEAAVLRVLSSGQVIMGPEVTGLETEVAEYCHAKFGIGCASGTDAILLALHALDIGPGDEVIIPPFTFFATVGSVVRTGATPVFADIDPRTYNIDPEQVAEKITPRTKAIMPVHLYGQCADMQPLWELSEKHNIPLIEDAAQAIGAEYHGKRVGTLGGICALSFYPSKNLGTYGDAGLITTDNPEWAAKMKAIRTHGSEQKYFHKYIGYNARIDAIQAAILRVKLPHLDKWTGQRQEAAARYDELIQDRGLDGFISRPQVMAGMRHVFNQYVIRVPGESRDALIAHFKASQVACDIYYPLPLHMQECLKYLNLGEGDFPESEAAAKCVLALPMYPDLTMEIQERVTDTLASFAKKHVRKGKAA
ncbi:DegT/DnrJ/EryC1/StrS family aminotransferase [Zavarzinella formosa]|uniref:DegT/DnrJ/EryC1/StrS family aminotransferase n=1 Tax=Zavarzinella formosa TaxID=360055 RepID=UPI00037E9A4B|nr:DegT/DnrJ/EryC1/StrS family aminotransferase [Zavarzinella formosa]